MRHYPTLADDELLKLIKSGDERAFTEIYNRYWEQLLAIGYYYTHDKVASEDIVQDVLLSLWTRRHSIEIHSLKSYLATAVKFSVFKSIAREKKRRQIREGQEFSESFSDIEEKLDAKFLQEYINGVLENFPEKTKLVFNYRRVEELSVADVAKQVDLSPKAIEYHLSKALRAFKAALEKIKILFV
jgi:RNA polymerase sigma-70 factor (ECF subfamily)